MGGLGFHALAAGALALLAGPLILFYFLKLKRPRMEVPSLVLWQQVINDRRVNSPFQRFKRNILLYLQLLLLALLVLATMQPYFRAGPSPADRIPVLIDNSASMAALDGPGGKTRLQAAKDEVRAMIDGLLSDQELAIVSFADTGRKVTGFTNNKRILYDALDGIEVQDVPSNLEDALRIAEAMARSEPFDRVVLLTDGNFPAKSQFELPYTLDYQRLEPAAPNIGITTLNAKRSEAGAWDVFVRVEGSADATTAATVEFLQNGEVVSESNITIAKGSGKRLVFPVTTTAASHIEVRLKPDHFDSLAIDNAAYLDLAPPRNITVYCPADLYSARQALQAIEEVTLFPAEGEEETDATEFDLVVTDRPGDKGLVALTGLYVGMVPEEAADLITLRQQATGVVDWTRLDPLLEYVSLYDLVILDEPYTEPEVTEGDFEQLGLQVVAHGQFGPLILKQQTPARTNYHFLFHPDRSTLPYRIGFPIMLSNAVKMAMHKAGLDQSEAASTGVLPAQTLQPEGTYAVAGPGGQQREVKADASGMVTGVPAPQVGRYRLQRNGEEVVNVGVSLVSPEETTLAGVEQIEFNEVSVAAAEAPLRVDRSLWETLAALALVVLLVEWWYFQHKPGGFRPRPVSAAGARG